MSDDVRQAWVQIKSGTVILFDNWLVIGRACRAAQTQIMKQAGVNKPHGKAYRDLMAAWMEENGLTDLDSHAKCSAIKCAEHEKEIKRWLTKLTDKERRRCNHATTVLSMWRRDTRPRSPGPKPSGPPPFADDVVIIPAPKPAQEATPKWRGWSEDAILRAAEGYHMSPSRNVIAIAKTMLNRAIRDETDLLELLRADGAADAQSIASNGLQLHA